MVKKKKISAGDRTFHIAVLVIVFLMCVITLYPIYYMLIVSISDGNAVLRGDITILPKCTACLIEIGFDRETLMECIVNVIHEMSVFIDSGMDKADRRYVQSNTIADCSNDRPLMASRHPYPVWPIAVT